MCVLKEVKYINKKKYICCRPKRSSGSDFWNLVAAEPKWIPEMGLEAEWERRRGRGGREGRTLFTRLYVSGRVNSLRRSGLSLPPPPRCEEGEETLIRAEQ